MSFTEEDDDLFSIAIDSRVGRLTITATSKAIAGIGWGGEPRGAETILLAEARHQLDAYFAGRLKEFDLPLTAHGSLFDQRVWRAMQCIPYGETRRYGELALELGSAPRAIGGACGRNPIPIVIPCHRIVGRPGLGGYSGGAGLPTKRSLLQLEGGTPPGLSFSIGSGRESDAAAAPTTA
jgi:methylated-DNA-[protein]-cysteine S-methyltransferase